MLKLVLVFVGLTYVLVKGNDVADVDVMEVANQAVLGGEMSKMNPVHVQTSKASNERDDTDDSKEITEVPTIELNNEHDISDEKDIAFVLMGDDFDSEDKVIGSKKISDLKYEIVRNDPTPKEPQVTDSNQLGSESTESGETNDKQRETTIVIDLDYHTIMEDEGIQEERERYRKLQQNGSESSQADRDGNEQNISAAEPDSTSVEESKDKSSPQETDERKVASIIVSQQSDTGSPEQHSIEAGDTSEESSGSQDTLEVVKFIETSKENQAVTESDSNPTEFKSSLSPSSDRSLHDTTKTVQDLLSFKNPRIDLDNLSESFGTIVASVLKKMSVRQRILAGLLINEVLLQGLDEELSERTKVQKLSPSLIASHRRFPFTHPRITKQGSSVFVPLGSHGRRLSNSNFGIPHFFRFIGGKPMSPFRDIEFLPDFLSSLFDK